MWGRSPTVIIYYCVSDVESIPKIFNTIVVTAGAPPAPCPGSPDKTSSTSSPAKPAIPGENPDNT